MGVVIYFMLIGVLLQNASVQNGATLVHSVLPKQV